MKIDIPYYIRQVLREQRSVYVPEIGTFTLLQASAHLSSDKVEIHPPELSLGFDDTTSEDDRLVKYIIDTGKYSIKSINQAISDYTQSTFNKLINVNRSEIVGVGVLKKESLQDKVTFTPALSELTREYKDLYPLKLKPIERIKEDNIVDHVVNTGDITMPMSSKFSWLQPIIAGILIAAIAIFLVKRCANSSDTSTFHNPDETTIGLGSDEDGDFNDSPDSKLTEKLDKEYSEVDSILSESGQTNDSEEDYDVNEHVKGSITNDALEKETNQAVKSVEVEKDNATITDDNKYAELIPESGKCIIIVGSFKKASNVIKMTSLIEREGKNIYTSQYNGKTRVGFTFDCKGVDLDSYLNEIRDRLSSQAWYLDPSISIPYN